MTPIIFTVTDLDGKVFGDLCCYIEQVPQLVEESFSGIAYSVGYTEGYNGTITLQGSVEKERAKAAIVGAVCKNEKLAAEKKGDKLTIGEYIWTIEKRTGAEIVRKKDLLLEKCLPTDRDWKSGEVILEDWLASFLERGIRLCKFVIRPNRGMAATEYGFYVPKYNNFYLSHLWRNEFLDTLVELYNDESKTSFLRAPKVPLNENNNFSKLIAQIKLAREKQTTNNITPLADVTNSINFWEQEKSRLTKGKKDLEIIIAELKPTILDYKNWLAEISKIDKVESVSIIAGEQSPCFKIYTKALEIKFESSIYKLGQYIIYISLDGGIIIKPHLGNQFVNGRCHPTVLDIRPIMGQLIEIVPRMVETQRYANLTQMIVRFLESLPEEIDLLKGFMAWKVDANAELVHDIS